MGLKIVKNLTFIMIFILEELKIKENSNSNLVVIY